MIKVSKKELFLFSLIFLLGAALRLYHLNFPLGLHGDEAWTGIEARRILTQGPIGIWSPSALGQPALPFYWTAVIFKFFGESSNTIRLSFVLLNIAALPFFYFSLCFLMKPPTALIAFLLFTTSHIFLNFSHTAPTHALFMVPFSITLFFFFLSLKTNRFYYFLVTGFFLGLSPYFYVGLRVFPLLFILFVAVKSFQKEFLKNYWKNLVLLCIVAFITFLPLGIYGLEHTADFMSRTNIVSIFSPFGLQHEGQNNSVSALVNNAQKTLLMFFWKGDTDPQDNYNSLPIFNSIAFFFFVIGFIVSFFSRKNEETVFLFFWFFVFLPGTLFTVDAPNFRRIQPTIAVSYIFVALGMTWVYQIGKRYLTRIKTFILILLCILLLYVVYDNITIFFTKQAVSPATKYIFTYPLVEVSDYIQVLPHPLYVYFYSTSWSYFFEPNRFLLYTIPGEDRSREFGNYSLSNNHFTQNVVYIFLPDYENALEVIKQQCPSGKIFVKKDGGETVFTAVFIPHDTCPQIL